MCNKMWMADKDAFPWRLFMHIVQICIWRMFNNGLPTVRGRSQKGGVPRWHTVWHFVLCCMFLGARRSTSIFINNKPNYLYSVLAVSLFSAPYCGYIACGPLSCDFSPLVFPLFFTAYPLAQCNLIMQNWKSGLYRLSVWTGTAAISFGIPLATFAICECGVHNMHAHAAHLGAVRVVRVRPVLVANTFFTIYI